MRIILGVAAALWLAAAARAEVVTVADHGFEVKEVAEVKAPAAKVYAALTAIGRWWDSEHSWSGSAANMTLTPAPGDCWCEKLPNGGAIRHLEVIGVEPGKGLRFHGGLGPLQFTGAAGHMNWTLTEKDGVTTVTWVYTVGGYAKEGFKTWAPAVDSVLGAALKRFKAYAETGKPA
ncbi:MAG TPA: SRPBCC family protein [Phenylobacterium sp.]|nr:SRPBCC family protein [Phenylobacterium sp.]